MRDSCPERIRHRWRAIPENLTIRKVPDQIGSRPGQPGIKTFFCSNVCAAYRREIYEELGGFVRHTIFNEDMIYAAKAVEAGYSVAYAADAQGCILIIIPMGSSFTETLTWEYRRQSIPRFLQHILRSPRENEW